MLSIGRVQFAPELPDDIRDKLNAAVEAWWASLPEDSKAQLEELVSGVGQLTQYRLGLLQYEQGAAQLAAAVPELEANAPKLATAKAQLDDGWKQYYDGLAQYEDGKKQLAVARAQLEDGWATLQDKKVQMANARRQDRRRQRPAERTPAKSWMTPKQPLPKTCKNYGTEK